MSICESKLTDFGFATKCCEKDDFMKKCGTPGYMGPEILREEEYGCKVDIFSAGVVLFSLLTGNEPWAGKSTKDTLKLNKKATIQFEYKDWKDLSFSVRHLVKCMLFKEPSERYNIK